MSELFMLTDAQLRRIEAWFPLSHGVPRVDDRRVISGIVFVIKNGLHWRDAPKEYSPHKTIYNRFVRWSRLGVFDKIFAELAAKGPKPERLTDISQIGDPSALVDSRIALLWSSWKAARASRQRPSQQKRRPDRYATPQTCASR